MSRCICNGRPAPLTDEAVLVVDTEVLELLLIRSGSKSASPLGSAAKSTHDSYTSSKTSLKRPSYFFRMVLSMLATETVPYEQPGPPHFLVDMNRGIFLLRAILKLAWANP
jgi:hypothetical protein